MVVVVVVVVVVIAVVALMQVEERLDAYLKAYDAVILGDGGLDFVLQILDDVTAATSAP